MSVEYDLLTGFDPSALGSVTKEQVLQMINQIQPLLNRGLVIHGTQTPDVANNPRFSRFIWLDSNTTPPTPKVYNTGTATWVSVPVGANSVTNASIDAAAAIAVTKLAIGTSRQILRTNLAGTANEFVSPTSIFNDGELPLARLSIAGAPADISYLQYNSASGTRSWQQLSFSHFPAGQLISPSLIQASASNNQVITTLAGIVGWQYVYDALADGTLPIAKLAGAGAATAAQVLRRNIANSAFEFGSLPFNRYEAIEASSNLNVTHPEDSADHVFNILHTLGTLPLFYRVSLVCKTADLNYNVGEEITIETVFHRIVGANSGQPVFNHIPTATSVRIQGSAVAAGERFTFNRSTGAHGALTAANWRLKIYVFV